MSELTADKADDQIDVYQAVLDRGSIDLKLLIHPRTDAVISASSNDWCSLAYIEQGQS